MDIQYKRKTDKTFEQALDMIKGTLADRGFGVLWEMNFKDKLHEKGLVLKENFMVLEACNPKKAEIVLNHDIEAGYFLPCKVAVYEKGDAVYIGMLKPTDLISLMGNEGLASIAQEVEDALVEAINEAI